MRRRAWTVALRLVQYALESLASRFVNSPNQTIDVSKLGQAMIIVCWQCWGGGLRPGRTVSLDMYVAVIPSQFISMCDQS